MYGVIIFLHVLGVFGFLMAHGVSAGVAFALRRERNLDRIRALLDLSGNSLITTVIAILVLLVTGIINGFMGQWWGRGWIWLSLGLLIAMFIYMVLAGSSYYSQVRKAAGVSYRDGNKQYPPGEPSSQEDIDQLLSQPRPLQLALIGFVSIAIIAWLMMFKPF